MANRAQQGCLCCGDAALTRETTIVSGFLAERAWNGLPEITALLLCKSCGFRFFERDLSDSETINLYRNTDYFSVRNRWEFFYTAHQHQAAIAWSHSPTRSAELQRLLVSAGVPAYFDYVLDHGGDAGQLLQAIEAKQKVVFDLSGTPAIQGVSAVSEAIQIPPACDLLLSCQVLEHVANPRHYLADLTKHCAENAYLYIEVPNEQWSNHVWPGRIRDLWLRFLLRHHLLLKCADAISTACRVKFKFLPPLGFIPMREHVNYFTQGSLVALLRLTGFSVIQSGYTMSNQLFAIVQFDQTKQR